MIRLRQKNSDKQKAECFVELSNPVEVNVT